MKQGKTRYWSWWALVDLAAWAAGLSAAVIARYELSLTSAHLSPLAFAAPAAGLLHVGAGHALCLYRGRHRPASFAEARTITLAVLLTAAALTVATATVEPRPVPISTPALGGACALVLMCAARSAWRARREQRDHARLTAADPILLYGAGRVGQATLNAMLDDPQARYRPVGLLDDDPEKRRLRIRGVPVIGGRDQIGAAVAATGARAIAVTAEALDPMLLADVRAHARAAGAALTTVPSIHDLLDRRGRIRDVTDIDLDEVLGRRRIETDLAAAHRHLTGKRILVLGAGGSIGAELCRQLHALRPAELMLLDRDESALHAVQLALHGRAMLDSPDTILADIRDVARIRAIVADRRPQVVFHAAALKHLPMLQRSPGEAVKTNVWGTLAVLDACAGVERFVNISTDKAANPVNVLGYSKRITERLTAHAGLVNPGQFLNVRFGNVLGSRGSVLTAFAAQVAAGGPITVTHPDITRYFMTVQEAVQLVIQASLVGRDGQALVLDMGAPVRIADVARRLAATAERPVEIAFTGLRPGEKLHEDLFGVDEVDERPAHPLISQVAVPALDPAEAHTLDPDGPTEDLIAALAKLAAAPAPVWQRASARDRTPLPDRQVTAFREQFVTR
ncbi:polysaccharide biosynthesis protein [Pilimelia columellifera]|uniref:Nucleoside-diphosphate sugar epimerase/dehydratase n=1 Tax=Pilimelia columellifera subsp. columellifera TaxID=706583 RepID=A0ABP6AZL7_9ACTN